MVSIGEFEQLNPNWVYIMLIFLIATGFIAAIFLFVSRVSIHLYTMLCWTAIYVGIRKLPQQTL